MLNVLTEELPAERESRFSAFILGAAGYASNLCKRLAKKPLEEAIQDCFPSPGSHDHFQGLVTDFRRLSAFQSCSRPFFPAPADFLRVKSIFKGSNSSQRLSKSNRGP